jgi:Holliday junction resolvasome RuvABC endonuclease subunit
VDGVTTLLSIDPGVNDLGWATWSWRRRKRLEAPLSCGVFSARDRGGLKRHWSLKIEDLMGQLWRVVEDLELRHVAIEMPESMGGAKGIAARKRGDVVHLAYCVGYVAAIAHAKSATVDPVRVSRWKGQLPKRVVQARVERAIGLVAQDGTRIASHAVDAVGVGLTVKGFALDDASVYGKEGS